LEDAVKATQKVLLSRDAVIITYLKMLRVTFNQSTGIQLQLKSAQLKNIDSLLEQLTKNQELAAKAVSRQQVAEVVTQFDAISPVLQETSSQALIIMSYGRVQSLFDKTKAIKNEMSTYIEQQPLGALKLSEKKRAFDQINQTMEGVETELKEVLSSFNDEDDRRNDTQVVEQLNQAYAGISRTLSYLQEVLTN
jgi:hypothetical protein